MGNRLNDEFAKGIEMSPLAETWNALRTRMDRALLCLVRVSGDDLDGGVARTPRVSGNASADQRRIADPDQIH